MKPLPSDLSWGQCGYKPKDLNRSGHGQSLADHTDVRAVAVAVAVLRLLTYINLLLHEA